MTIGIVFDLDGTIADTKQDIAASVNILRKRFNRAPLSLDEIVSYVGNGSRKLVERSLKGESPEFIDKAFAEYNSCYLETVCVHSKLYHGVKEGLKKLHEAGFKMAVISNKPNEITCPLIEQLGIAPFFDLIQGGKAGIPLKPDPASTLAFLQSVHAQPNESWILGDNYTDLGAGRAAGMLRGFAAWGYGTPKEEEWDFKAECFMDFVNHLIK